MPRPALLDFHVVVKHCRTCNILLNMRCSNDVSRKKYCSRRCKAIDYHKHHNGKPSRSARETYEKIGRTRSRLIRLGLIPKPPRPSPESYRVGGLKRRGANNHKWIHDRTKVKQNRFNASDRPLIKTWRTDVFHRDGYTCRICSRRGAGLNAHHIRPWASFPEDRYKVDNGITLCRSCHGHTHNGGNVNAPTLS